MSVELIRTADQLRNYLGKARGNGGIVGLVPTMGALHEGHGGLIGRARGECDILVVSIFVNPLQFGEGEDYDRYPRSLGEDLVFCEVRKVDAVFAPSKAELYGDSKPEMVEVGIEAEHLCGPSRPGHFSGVATAVLRVFASLSPDRAYFGEKDLQQLAVIRRMVADRNLPIEIVGVETQRETDGLAISSRNQYLSNDERQVATVLNRALRVAPQRIGDGDRDPQVGRAAALRVLELEPTVRVDYLEIVDPYDMQPVDEITGPVHAAAAIWIGQTRLIDNVPCELSRKARRSRQK